MEKKAITNIFEEKYKTYNEMLNAVKKSPCNIAYIRNPSRELQELAINSNITTLLYINNLSEEVALKAVQMDYDAIRFIKRPSEEVQLAALSELKKHFNYYSQNGYDFFSFLSYLDFTPKIIEYIAKNMVSKKIVDFIVARNDIDWKKIPEDIKLLLMIG